MRGVLLFILTVILCPAQAPAPRTILGTIASLRPETAEIEIRPDAGTPVVVKVNSTTITQRIAPGQTDLTKESSISASDLISGDRVLVTLSSVTATNDGTEARRIIVVPGNDLAKRDAADRADWQRRGVAGIVVTATPSNLIIEDRSLGGATKYTVTPNSKTSIRRYAPNSVRFSDAKAAPITEARVGDQLRARGTKSEDGLKVDADEIVFGTFLSRAGTITAVNAESQQIIIKDLANNKPLTIGFIPDSRIRRMPEGGMGRGGRGGPGGPAPAGPAPIAGRGPTPAPPAGMAAAPAPGRGPAPQAAGSAAPQKGPNIAQILETLPPVKLEDLKPGEVIVLAAIPGAKSDNVTAVTLIANAEVLVQMAMAASGNTGQAPSLAGIASSIAGVGP